MLSRCGLAGLVWESGRCQLARSGGRTYVAVLGLSEQNVYVGREMSVGYVGDDKKRLLGLQFKINPNIHYASIRLQ